MKVLKLVNKNCFDVAPYQVRPYNADKTKNMRSLNPEDIDQLITVEGMVIRSR